LGAARDQLDTSPAKELQEIERRGVVHRIGVTSLGCIENRLTIEKPGIAGDPLLQR
jgi:hypothetical protein